ncbi:hypothetical protein U1Q18_022157, partial [Sarracenia purpurea var. burkii]
ASASGSSSQRGPRSSTPLSPGRSPTSIAVNQFDFGNLVTIATVFSTPAHHRHVAIYSCALATLRARRPCAPALRHCPHMRTNIAACSPLMRTSTVLLPTPAHQRHTVAHTCAPASPCAHRPYAPMPLRARRPCTPALHRCIHLRTSIASLPTPAHQHRCVLAAACLSLRTYATITQHHCPPTSSVCHRCAPSSPNSGVVLRCAP